MYCYDTMDNIYIYIYCTKWTSFMGAHVDINGCLDFSHLSPNRAK